MFKNYFNIAVRNLWRHKGLSFINIFGLATGMACSLLIFSFVADELSYDRFNRDADRIVRVVKDFVNSDGSHLPDATTPPPLAPAMQKDIPGIEHVTRVYPGWGGNFLISYKDKNIYTEKLFRVDSSFFDVFTFPFVEGNAKDAFKQVQSILITQTAAKRYFGSENPMGKVLRVDRLGDLMVTGVLKDVPDNAHFHFDFLVSIRKFQDEFLSNWNRYEFYTYVKLQPNVTAAAIEPKIQALYKRNRPEENNVFYTQALTNIHLDSNLKWEIEPNSERLYVVVFAIIGLLIILIASINYINLVTARSSLRAKEIGIRKVSGAYRISLVKQFLFESVATGLLAAVAALVIAQLLLPLVNTITAKHLILFGPGSYVVFYFFAAAIIVGISAGLFPALYLSSFRPVIVLKGTKMKEQGVFNLRKALVVVQFTISIALIAGSFVIYQQLHYIQSARLGLNKDQVLIIRNYSNLSGIQKLSFQNEITQIQGVKDAAGSSGIIGGMNGTTRLNVRGSDKGSVVNLLAVGYNYLRVLGIHIKEGRNFSPHFPGDTISYSRGALERDYGGVILNERAVKDLAVPSPVLGQQLLWHTDGDTNYYARVIGVVNDFHFASFKNEIKPFAFVVSPQRTGNLTVKLSTQDISSTLQKIAASWKQFAPDRPFQYTFLDDTFAKLYQAETNFQKVFIALVAISIIIACLGLFGLAAFMAEQRIKEIGIRKVLGASVAGITTMLSKDFLKLVLISIIIATPLAWWAMNEWLQQYAYRITINGWIFLLAAGLSMLIATITISFQAIKAAIANPVKSLRTE